HFCFFYFQHYRRDYSGGGGNSQWLSCNGSFSEELALVKQCNHSFLAGGGRDRDLYPAALNVQHRVRCVALGKNGLSFSIVGNLSPDTGALQVFFSIKLRSCR